MMRFRIRVLAIVAALAAVTGASGQAPPYAVLDPDSFQSFIANWTPATQPLCAVLQSQADWDKVMHPAPVMGGNKPFAPPAEFWARNAVLLIARVVGSGDMAKVFTLQGVRSTADAIEVGYAFASPPPASAQVKWWLGVRVAKPLPATARFVENGHVVCTAR
jgi:hypothetical protein